jgi:hypothetical protein
MAITKASTSILPERELVAVYCSANDIGRQKQSINGHGKRAFHETEYQNEDGILGGRFFFTPRGL